MQNHHSYFRFNKISAEEVYKEIGKLNLGKSVQNIDIPIRGLQENADILADNFGLFN